MPGPSTSCAPAVAAALLAVLTAPAALAGTGPSCFQIATDSHGFAPGTGVDVVDVKPTTATIVVNYFKSFPCRTGATVGGVGQRQDQRQLLRDSAGWYRAASNSFQQQRFDMSDLTPNTDYSARGAGLRVPGLPHRRRTLPHSPGSRPQSGHRPLWALRAGRQIRVVVRVLTELHGLKIWRDISLHRVWDDRRPGDQGHLRPPLTRASVLSSRALWQPRRQWCVQHRCTGAARWRAQSPRHIRGPPAGPQHGERLTAGPGVPVCLHASWLLPDDLQSSSLVALDWRYECSNTAANPI